MLGVGLISLGQPGMAASVGLLHALGKAGSAFGVALPFWPARCVNPWRLAVVASRGPAVAASVMDLQNPETGNVMGFTVLTCYMLWTAADLRLMKS